MRRLKVLAHFGKIALASAVGLLQSICIVRQLLIYRSVRSFCRSEIAGVRNLFPKPARNIAAIQLKLLSLVGKCSSLGMSKIFGVSETMDTLRY